MAINRDIFKLRTQWDGSWDKGSMVDNSIVADDRGWLYTLIIPRYSNLKNAALLWSKDQGRTWAAVAMTGRNASIEKSDSFNDKSGPPSVLSFETYGSIVGGRAWLNLPVRKDESVTLGQPSILLSDHSLLTSNHSGAGNSTFTTKDKIFVVYDTTDASAPGTLSVMRQFNRASKRLESEEIPVGRSTTLKTPDNHDLPAITMGPDRRPIIVIGAHHARFLMFTAKEAGTLISGLKFDGPVGGSQLNGAGGSYSYVSLNTSRDGTINIIARAESDETRYQLVQLRKPWQRPWTVWPNGLLHRVIAQPSRPHYAAWRQRVTMARDGRLFLNFRYFPNMLTDVEAASLGIAGSKPAQCIDKFCWYNNAPELAPVTLESDDNGGSWH
jgi:hypothetical protein